MIKINLIPPEILAEQEKRLRVTQSIAVVALLALIVAGVTSWRWNTERSLSSHRDEIKAELSKVNEKVKQVEEFEAKLNAVQARLDVITSLLKGRLLYPYFLEDFARALTHGIWINTINSSTSGAGLKLQISAHALEKSQIADWIRSLESYGNTVDSSASAAPPPAKPGSRSKEASKPPNRYSDIELGSIQATSAGGTQTYTFTLNCTYQNPKL